MVERRPLVKIDTDKKESELPIGDTIPADALPPGLASTDVQSGMYFVPLGDEYLININHQSINKGGLDLEGDLLVDGQFFAEI